MTKKNITQHQCGQNLKLGSVCAPAFTIKALQKLWVASVKIERPSEPTDHSPRTTL
jgi:hypothetical protein